LKDKVALAGACGKMGVLLARSIFASEDLQLVAAIDPAGGSVCDLEIYPPQKMAGVLEESGAGVLIDFTNADAARDNSILAAGMGLNLVLGTTGMTPEQLDDVRNAVEGEVAAVVAPNFSTGVNVLLAVSHRMASMLPGFDMEIIEAHHGSKMDSPSGTALALYESVVDGRGEKLPAKYGRSGMETRGEDVGIHSIRAGEIVGEHTILFAGPGESLELTHRAASRQAFVDGTLLAVRWLRDRQPGLYSMADVLGL